jgi:hypothetical protein
VDPAQNDSMVICADEFCSKDTEPLSIIGPIETLYPDGTFKGIAISQWTRFLCSSLKLEKEILSISGEMKTVP